MRPLSAECALSDRTCAECPGTASQRGLTVACRHTCHIPAPTPHKGPKTWKQIMADAKAAKGKK